MPMFRADMLAALLGDVVWTDDLHENFLEILLTVFVAKLRQRAFCQQFAGLNYSDGVAELLNLTHDVRGKNDRLPAVAALLDESGDRARGHHIERVGRFVKN